MKDYMKKVGQTMSDLQNQICVSILLVSLVSNLQMWLRDPKPGRMETPSRSQPTKNFLKNLTRNPM